ncbi:MAG: T9SS type A sorting domain-containing protein [Ignavibacteria bacterium]|nr:T9SS type A sorting domain-containing protein [Ignavibacteria bacterium]
MITGIEDTDASSPKGFSLLQNYPNPFNPTTKINYSIPQTGIVTLKVFDILGNEIATLINEEQSAGEYEVEFSADGGSAYGGNVSNLSSGIYFYKITAGNYKATMKMILLK